MCLKKMIIILGVIFIFASCDSGSDDFVEPTPTETEEEVTEAEEEVVEEQKTEEEEVVTEEEEEEIVTEEEEEEIVTEEEEEVVIPDPALSNNIGTEIVVLNGGFRIRIGAATIGVDQRVEFKPQDGVPDFIDGVNIVSVDVNLPNFKSEWIVYSGITGNIISISNSLQSLKAVNFDTLIPNEVRDIYRVFNIIYEEGILENYGVGQSFNDVRALVPNKAALSQNQIRIIVRI